MNKQKSSWLSKISVLSAKHINAGFIIWTIIIALGLICYLQVMKREGFPNVQSPIGSAIINYPVNDKNIVDEKIKIMSEFLITSILLVVALNLVVSNNID
jgi:tellurite resistance protein TehA-like permease